MHTRLDRREGVRSLGGAGTTPHAGGVGSCPPCHPVRRAILSSVSELAFPVATCV